MSPERGKYRITFHEITSKAKELMLQDGQHVPILVIEGSKSLSVNLIHEMPETHGERLELLRFIGQVAAKDGRFGQLRQVFLISEGWMSASSEGRPPEMRPSQDPNRKEVLIISGLKIEGLRKSLKLFEMVRNQNKQVVDLPEILPPKETDGTVEIPLLEAFAQGFQLAFQARAN